jgi:hypothetical protein
MFGGGCKAGAWQLESGKPTNRLANISHRRNSGKSKGTRGATLVAIVSYDLDFAMAHEADRTDVDVGLGIDSVSFD